MEDEQSFDNVDDTEVSLPSWYVGTEFFFLLLLLPVGFLDLCSRKSNRSRDAKRTQNLMVSVFISNAVFQMVTIVSFVVCIDCYMQQAVWVITYLTMRAVNWIFIIHRAKLVQGMSPVMSSVWFERRLPIIVATIVLAFTAYSFPLIFMMDLRCFPYSDTDSIHFCNPEGGHNGFRRRDMIMIWINIVVDILWTAFLIILFVIPLRRVYRVNLGRMNVNQLRQRRKLKSLLYWSVMLTVINQVSTIAVFIPPLIDAYRYPMLLLVVYTIGKFNPSINVWSSWLMIGRNRRYLQRCCCCSSSSRESVQSRGLTDQQSANSVPKFRSESTIEMSNIGSSTSQIIPPMISRLNTPVLLQGS